MLRRCMALTALALCSLVATVQSHCTVDSVGDLHIPNSFIIKTLGPYYIGQHKQGSYYVQDYCNVSGNQDSYHAATRFKSCDDNGNSPTVVAVSKDFGKVYRVGKPVGHATVYIDVYCAPYVPNRYRRNIRKHSYMFGFGDGRALVQFI